MTATHQKKILEVHILGHTLLHFAHSTVPTRAPVKSVWKWQGRSPPTFERRDSGDSSMWRSSELSISNNIPVILPARVGCMLWIRGNRRSPRKKKRHREWEISDDEHSLDWRKNSNASLLVPPWKPFILYFKISNRVLSILLLQVIKIPCTYLTSAFVLVEGQKPTWKQSRVPDLAHGQQAAN